MRKVEQRLSARPARTPARGLNNCPSLQVLLESHSDKASAIRRHVDACRECRMRERLLVTLRQFGLRPSAVLSGEMALEWHIFLDESGRSIRSFENKEHPSLGLAAVITTPDKLAAIDTVRAEVVTQAGLPSATEIHANPCLLGKDAFKELEPAQREELLWNFVDKNRDNYLFFYAPNMLKTLVRRPIQQDLSDRGLSQYTAVFLHLLVVVGKFVEVLLHGEFRVFFDRNDAVMDDLVRVATHLRSHENARLRIKKLRGTPQPLDSARSSAVQLADVIAHYACRKHQLEIPAFDHDPRLNRFSDKIESFYHTLLKPKDLPWLISEIYYNLDLKALEHVSLVGNDG